MRPLRVLSNTDWFEGHSVRDRPVESVVFPSGGLASTLRLFSAARRCDAVVLNLDERRLLLLSLLKRVIGMKQCRLISVDIHLAPPRTIGARLRARLVGWLLQSVDLLICYCKETRRMEVAFGLDRRRFAHVPFKVNRLDAVRAVEPTDEGFALVCGRSDRDYRTLAAAVGELDVPIVVLTSPSHVAYNNDIDCMRRLRNVIVARDDDSAESWINWIARARCVVLPVLPDVVKPSGISAYLVAMALGKCVIITQSPATEGLIDQGQAVVVPPGDGAALRDAIRRVTHDPTYRSHIAAQGKAYALSLGDESRLADDVVRCVGTFIDSSS